MKLDLPWEAPTPTAAPNAYVTTRPALGTVVRVCLRGLPAVDAAAAADAAFRALEAVAAVASEWDAGSELSRLVAGPVGAWQDVSPALAHLLNRAQLLWRLSGGAFDPTWGRFARAWSMHVPAAELPDAPPTRAAARRAPGMEALELDGQRVRQHASLSLGLGGLAKGTAADAMLDTLRAAGARSALVDAGGDVVAFTAPGDAGWPVGVTDAQVPGRLADHLTLTNGAVATSGVLEQFVVRNGRRVGHLLDPRTGEPAQRALQCTVCAPTLEWADGIATAAFVLGPRTGARWLSSTAGLPPAEARWVAPSGRVTYTPGWPRS